MAANLNGTYENPLTGETLVITNSDDSKGTFSGALSERVNGQEIKLNVSGGYHFFNSVGNPTSISFTALRPSTATEPELREVWSGTSDASNYNQIQMMGVRSILKNAQGDKDLYAFTGPFIRR
jgi:hypothetical protein